MKLTMLLDMACEGFGDRVLVGRRSDGLTAVQLRSHALNGATLATEQGADSVVYLGSNGPAFPVAMFAAAYAGVPLVPLNYRLGAGQLEKLLTKHPSALVIAEGSATSLVERQGHSPRTPETWLQETAGAAPDDEEADSDAAAVVIYTSGT